MVNTRTIEASPRPFYVPAGREDRVFRTAYEQRLPILLKGPTGVGKTRFVEAMAHDLGVHLITVACHEDLSAADLVGRHLLRNDATEWVDGPLTRAVREGSICYLDEIVEARQDTTVVLHSLTDHRRILPIDRLDTTLEAAPGFSLVISYNPGYQSLLKDLKESTRQRFVAIEFEFPPPAVEIEVLVHEGGIDEAQADQLVTLGQAIRRLEVGGLREVASPRTLVSAALLVAGGLEPAEAAWAAIGAPLTDDPVVSAGLRALINTYLPSSSR